MSEQRTRQVADFNLHRTGRMEELSNEMIERTYQYAIGGLESLGYPPLHLDMVKQYLADTRVTQMDVAPSSDFPEGSQMTVQKLAITQGRRTKWHHAMLLHPDNLERNLNTLQTAFAGPSTSNGQRELSFKIDPIFISRIAQMWTMFNLMGGIASEAAYVVHNYQNKFQPGFNGHSPHFRHNHFLSRLYLQAHPLGVNEFEDAQKFNYGLGLYLLSGVLRSEHLRLDDKQAREAVDQVLLTEQLNMRVSMGTPYLAHRAYPHNPEELAERLSQMPDVQPNVLKRPDARKFGGFVLLTNPDL